MQRPAFRARVPGPRPTGTAVARSLMGRLGALLTLLGQIWGVAGVQAAIPGTFQAPRAIPDGPYLQETGRQVPHDTPLLAVARHGDDVWVGAATGPLRLEGGRLHADPSLVGAIRRLVSDGGQLWAVGGGGHPGLWRRAPDRWVRVSDEPVTDVIPFRDSWLVSVGNRLWRVVGDGLVALSPGTARFPIARLTSHQGTLFVQGPGRLAPYAAGVFGGLDAYTWPSDQAWDWGTLPSRVIRDAFSSGQALYLATDRGLGVLRGMSLTTLGGAQGLPFEDALCLAAGFTNDLWIGTTRGAIRRHGDQFDYFAGRRWVPGDRVEAIACGPNVVYLATDGGLGILEYKPYTLAKKAAYYERHLERWGQKRLGFVHKLEWDETAGRFMREVSDNDGGYSGNYLAAQCYRYAVTRDPAARREATNTFHAIRWLEAMTGIPGFPARSVWAKGESGHKAGHGSGNYAAEWHDTADGRFEWKGDTSSDELCSHFYALALFLDLVAQGDEIGQARRHLARVAGHLLDHGWQLVDRDGKPTRWGRWDPDYFTTEEGLYDRGLQAVQLLSFMKTAEVLTGETRFGEAYRTLVGLGYPGFTLRARNTFPPESVLHFLDELAFWSFWNLLRLETDADRKALYRRGYERGYEVVRVEENPFFNYLHGALTGSDGEPDRSARHLRSWPLDLRVWSYQNSHRTDLSTPPGYVAPKGGTRTFPPRETEPLRWDHWLMQADGGAGGREVAEPSGWLLAYWMGRYHGFLGAPETTDAALLEGAQDVDPGGLEALPYQGPARPDLP